MRRECSAIVESARGDVDRESHEDRSHTAWEHIAEAGTWISLCTSFTPHIRTLRREGLACSPDSLMLEL